MYMYPCDCGYHKNLFILYIDVWLYKTLQLIKKVTQVCVTSRTARVISYVNYRSRGQIDCVLGETDTELALSSIEKVFQIN